MPFGSRLKQARLRKNMTQAQLAKEVGVTKGAIGNYESEVSSPKEDILIRLMEVLEVDANFLFQDLVHSPFPDETAKPPDRPKTIEARILSAGIDKMPAEDRERALAMMRMIFTQYADYFERSDQNDA